MEEHSFNFFNSEMDNPLLLTLVTLTLWHIWKNENRGIFDSVISRPITTSERIFVNFRQLQQNNILLIILIFNIVVALMLRGVFP